MFEFLLEILEEIVIRFNQNQRLVDLNRKRLASGSPVYLTFWENWENGFPGSGSQKCDVAPIQGILYAP